jgi:hypothetical protein
MATRSAIGVMHGTVLKVVYCHWDGYLAHNGKILSEHYADSAKANNLVAQGDISSLGAEIGEQHAFSRLDTEMPLAEYEAKYGHMTTFYGRDRGEENVGHKTFTDFEQFLEWADGCGCEFYYIMNQGQWYVGNFYERDGRHYRQLQLLAESLEIEGAEEAA